jgi:hypothetical protein
MTKKNIILFALIFIQTLSFGQKIGEMFICADSLRSYQFRLLSDSIIEFSTKWRHMQPPIRANFYYNNTDSTIEILRQKIEPIKSNQGGIFIETFKEIQTSILRKIKSGFIDDKNKIIFVSETDFGKSPKTLYIVDGKKYFQNNGETNGYGLLQKKGKKNRKLQKRLKYLNKDKCDIEIVKGGLVTYKKYGIESAFGAIIITTRK